MAKACEECTNNCLMMHKKHKKPASVVTTFVKVMIGDNYSKTLFLPPNFACRVKKLAGKKTSLEDLNGEKWDVKVKKIDDRLAFEEGWDNFALKHGLQKGDILVFHCIMKSHFVVLMYGATGCPELRHFAFSHKPMKETKRSDNNLIENGQSSSKVHTNCNNLSHESSSKSEPVNAVNDMKTVDKKLKDSNMSPNEDTTSTQYLIASSSQPMDKENDSRSKPLVENAFTDYVLSESPTTVKPLCLVDNDNGHEQDECRRNSLQPVVVESNASQKNNVAASAGGSDEIGSNKIQKSVEPDGGLISNVVASGRLDETETDRTRKSVESDGDQKNNVAAIGRLDETETNRTRKSVESDGDQKNNVAAIGRLDETETDRTRKSMESGGGQKNNVAAIGGGSDESGINSMRKVLEKKIQEAMMNKRLRPVDVPSQQTLPPEKTVKREPVPSVSRLHNSGYPSTLAGNSTEPMAKWTEPTKEEPTINHGSVGLVKTEPAMNYGFGDMIKKEPKSEPVDDDDEAPPSGSSNISFSATMSSYQYLELPSCLKLKPNVIYLRNGDDLWPVLYQAKHGLKALTQTWSIFAKEKGIKPGDVCEFVLESEGKNSFTSSVFGVHITRR